MTLNCVATKLARDDTSVSSTQNFDSEESVCGLVSTSGEEDSSLGVEILGIEVLLDELDLTDDDDGFINLETDSLELARKRLPHIRHPRHRKPERFIMRPWGRCDSLELTRKRLPHLARTRRRRPSKPNSLLEERRRKLRELQIEFKQIMRKAEEDDVSTTSSESLFSMETVDSLILTRRRFAEKKRRAEPITVKEISFRPRRIIQEEEQPKGPQPGNFDFKRHVPPHHGSFHDLVKKSKPNSNGATMAA